MSTPAQHFTARVLGREQLSSHLVRLTIGGDGLAGFVSTGIHDEWVGLVVPGQFQSRYYTVRSWDGREMVIDVVVHDVGLVTEWAMGDCVGDEITITEAKGSFGPPDDARWLYLVGDLTALPAMARIVEAMGAGSALQTRVWAEAEPIAGYFPEHLERAGGLSWLTPPAPGVSDLAAFTETLVWPQAPGYFWMSGESAQMRAIRKHLMRVVRLPSTHYDVMGYWRAAQPRQPRAVDPGPIYRAGKAAGKSDDEIWADYDAAREGTE